MKWKGLYMLIVWFSCIALLLKILGYLLPWWFVVQATNGSGIERYFVGIVFGLDCVAGMSNRNCSEYSIGRVPSEINYIVETSSMLTIQIAMSVNVGFLFISCMIIIGISVAKAYNKGLMVLTVVLLSVSCAAYFVTLGFFIYVHINDIRKTDVYEYNRENFPWSILVTSIAAIFLLGTLVLMVVALCRWRDDDDASYLTDDYDRKVTQYPETRYVYDNPKQYVMDRPLVHSGGSKREYVYAVDNSRSTPYQQITYPADTMYRPYSAARRY